MLMCCLLGSFISFQKQVTGHPVTERWQGGAANGWPSRLQLPCDGPADDHHARHEDAAITYAHAYAGEASESGELANFVLQQAHQEGRASRRLASCFPVAFVRDTK
jgi:hypothetical protein